MPSFLSRFRTRATSQSTVSSLSSSTAVPVTPIGTQETRLPTQLPSALTVNRKILEDPDSYLESEGEPVIRGLTPNRRHSVDGSNRGFHFDRPQPPLDSTLETDEQGAQPPTPSSAVQSAPTKMKFAERISQFSSGGEWSTFGRHKDRQTPKIGEFSEQSSPRQSRLRNSYSPSLRRTYSNKRSKAPSTTGSIRSTMTANRSANPSRPSTAPHESQLPSRNPSRDSFGASMENAADSKRSSPTTSSKRLPRTPSRPRSNTAPTVHSSGSYIAQMSTPASQEYNFDSPRTFGYPTPPDTRSGFMFTHPSPPPPLPPLNHPELTNVLSFQPRLFTDDVPKASQSGIPLLQAGHSKTLPARFKKLSGDETAFPTLSSAFERSIRHHSSLPGAHEIFDSPLEDRLKLTRKHSRARTISGRFKLKRRSSADWCAHHATIGVNSGSDHSWPADVSREILRLSLAQGDTATASGLSGNISRPASSGKNKELAPRGPSVPTDPEALVSEPESFSPARLSYHRTSSPEGVSSLQGGEDLELIGPISGPHHALFGSASWDKMTEDRLHEAAAVSVESSASSGKVENAQAARQAALIQDTPAASLVKKLGSPLIQKSRQSASLASPISETPSRHSSVTKSSNSQPPSTVVTPLRTMSDKGKGKRKAEEVDITPPDQKKEGQRATFVIPAEGRTQRISASGSSSHAPSSYHRKRARLSSPPPPSQSRPTSAQANQFGSWSSQTSSRALPAPRAPSRAASTRSNNPQSLARQPSDRRRSMSQISIPISALVSPHAPSITTSSKFHMRDPRKPPKKLHDTEWSLRFKTEDEPGSSLHAWAFFIGFILFPAWWIAALFFRVPRTRTVGEPEIEKAVTIDDPQVEHDAKTWRFRCRVMSIISVFTYIPFIVLVAIFVPR